MLDLVAFKENKSKTDEIQELKDLISELTEENENLKRKGFINWFTRNFIKFF